MAGIRKMAKAGSPCNCTTLRKATRRISQLYDTALAPSGLKTTQRAILAHIGRSEPTTVNALAEDLMMDSSAVTHSLKPLERDDLVAIAVDPSDRRSRLIKLTPQGRAKLTEMDALWASAQVRFEQALGTAGTNELRRLLNLLISDEFIDSFRAGSGK